MPDYKRLVSYIYNYEDGMKKNNVGYARVEARNGQCKCTLHIAAPSINDKELQVYIFSRKEEGLAGILLGNMLVKNGTGDYKTVTDSRHIMNSEFGIEDMGGIVLYFSERKFFATAWDDFSITLKMVAGMNSKGQDRDMKAATVTAERPAPVAKREEEMEEDVPDNIIQLIFKNTDRHSERDRTETIIELDDHRDPKEGEVFNDRKDDYFSKVRKPDREEEDDLFKIDASKIKEALKQPMEAAEPVIEPEPAREPESVIEPESAIEPEPAREPESVIEPESAIEPEHAREAESAIEPELVREPEPVKEPETLEDGFHYYDYGTGEDMVIGDKEETDGNTQSLYEQMTNVLDENSYPEDQLMAENPDIQTEDAGEDSQSNSEKQQPFFEDHPLAKRIYRSYPRMYPFEDNEIAWCVRIEPQDIGLFPVEAWLLGNNSFLLHGYYSYRHLIFARINDKNGFNYILGVPGIYHNREKFMAKMFGFENFKCVKRKAQRTGEFGYWYIPITLN
jgi:hypothetical protein